MTKKDITIRIKMAGYEIEVCGPEKWAEKTIANFVKRIKQELLEEKK